MIVNRELVSDVITDQLAELNKSMRRLTQTLMTDDALTKMAIIGQLQNKTLLTNHQD